MLISVFSNSTILLFKKSPNLENKYLFIFTKDILLLELVRGKVFLTRSGWKTQI